MRFAKKTARRCVSTHHLLSPQGKGVDLRQSRCGSRLPALPSSGGKVTCAALQFTYSQGQRIVGAGGEIKLRGEAAAEQRLRLSMEGVKFRGKRVNMEIYEHTLRSWETFD